MRLSDLLRNSCCDGVVAVNLIDAKGRAFATINLDQRFEAEEMLSALWEVAKENSHLGGGSAVTYETMMTTDQYVFLVRPVGNNMFVQLVMHAYSDLEEARDFLATLEDGLPDML
jgi:hypothetical protein